MTECVIANPTRRKFIITADPTQIDLPCQQQSGLKEATKYLKDVEGISFVQLDEYDFIRHPLVRKVVEAYVKNEKK
ncbi:MAG: PhoH family protein [Bacteroidales bacterium]|nr:PhoH family protein [Bacteroidales bacterium]MDD4684350.1 PhoH family protein [Bacteroidales bacterium]